MPRALATLPTLAAVALAVSGCGAASQQHTGTQAKTSTQASLIPSIQSHPQAVSSGAPGTGTGTGTGVSVSSPSGGLAQPVSIDQIKAQLKASGITADNSSAILTSDGLAIAPVNAPQAVQEVIDAGNEIAHLPYRFGGGHGTFIDNAYDCSGSLSFVFAAAGILNTTMTSGQLESWGDPGPGKWITVFANAGHTFAYIAGLRFDTVALAETGSRWSNRSADEPDLHTFVIRHPPGL